MSQYEINHYEFISLNFYFTVWSYIVAMRTLLKLERADENVRLGTFILSTITWHIISNFDDHSLVLHNLLHYARSGRQLKWQI